MFTPLYRLLIVLSFLSCNTVSASADNPFAKNDRVNIGKDISWKIDKKAVSATKSISDNKGAYYHLGYDNKQIKLALSTDAKGLKPKKFNQLEIADVKLDGKQVSIFKWCLSNQQRHDRFLQQGLSVKNNVCVINSDDSSFTMQLNEEMKQMLQQARRLSIVLKPFRTRVELNYDISDFADMTLALNAKPEEPVVVANKKCWAGPPAEYKSIKSVEYDCADEEAINDAEAWVTKLVKEEKAKQQVNSQVNKDKEIEKQRVLALQKAKKRKLEEANKKKRLAEKLQRDKKLQAEAVAIAASKANQLKINNEITEKMLDVCGKYWDKGEHRCYCQKYIEHAPSDIKANSSCK